MQYWGQSPHYCTYLTLRGLQIFPLLFWAMVLKFENQFGCCNYIQMTPSFRQLWLEYDQLHGEMVVFNGQNNNQLLLGIKVGITKCHKKDQKPNISKWDTENRKCFISHYNVTPTSKYRHLDTIISMKHF